MELKFRALTAEEIDVRVDVAFPKDNPTWCTLVLYKDARVDMDILDETVGPLNWKREHSRDNANCVVSIWDDDKNQWITREDTGTESNYEKEKGLASDSFKRACINVGIGRELYTAPFILVTDDCFKLDTKGRIKTRFFVSDISINEKKKITSLAIVNDRGQVCFEMKEPTSRPKKVEVPAFSAATPKEEIAAPIEEPPKMYREEMINVVYRLYAPEQLTRLFKASGVSTMDQMTDEQLSSLMGRLRKAGKI